jgi:hypothetical protein
MSRISRVVVFVTALMSVFAVLSSSASAISTWKSTNTTAFTADGNPISISGNGKTISCTGASLTGAVSALDFTGAIWTNAIHGNITYSGCVLAGSPYALTCTYSFNANGITGTQVAGTLNLNSPNGCRAAVGGVFACVFEGGEPETYDNPPDAKMTSPAGTLTVTNGGAVPCPLIVPPSTHGVATVTATTFTVTGAAPPIISGT